MVSQSGRRLLERQTRQDSPDRTRRSQSGLRQGARVLRSGHQGQRRRLIRAAERSPFRGKLRVMLCISVAPVSRKLAKADLLNAAGQCDLIELCLDHLIKEPDVGDMLQGISKPILVTCRRSADGGKFEGTEEERMTLLRQAIVAGPHAVELDLETAAKIPRFGKTKRVISVTTLDGPPDDLDAVFQEMAAVHADVAKFAWPAP